MADDGQQRIGVALIGAGMIAPTHVKALSAARDNLRLAAVVSRHPDKARHLADLYEGETPRFTSDVDAIAADPEIHFAIVATPPSVRAGLIGKLAEAGKHILLEKPVGRNTTEALQVVEICEAAGVNLGILFQHRVRPPSIAAARHLESGALGRLGLAEIAVPIWRDQSYYDELGRGTYDRDGGGVMITNAIHSIDLALSLTGPVQSVQAMTATTLLHRMEAEDFAVAGLRFASGAVGSFIASTAIHPHRSETVTLHFEKAVLRIDKDALQIDWRDGGRELEAQSPPAEEGAHMTGGRHEWHQGMIEQFAEALRSGGKPLVTGREALAAHRLIEAIEQSSREGMAVTLEG
jgi:predicted dehydrogenase